MPLGERLLHVRQNDHPDCDLNRFEEKVCVDDLDGMHRATWIGCNDATKDCRIETIREDGWRLWVKIPVPLLPEWDRVLQDASAFVDENVRACGA